MSSTDHHGASAFGFVRALVPVTVLALLLSACTGTSPNAGTGTRIGTDTSPSAGISSSADTASSSPSSSTSPSAGTGTGSSSPSTGTADRADRRDFDPLSPPGETRPPLTLKLTSAALGDGAPNGGASQTQTANGGASQAGATNGAASQTQSASRPIKLTGNAKPGWHSIDRSPTMPGAGSHRAFPGGTVQEWDADSPDSGWTTYGQDGTIDTTYPDGSRTTLSPGGLTDSPGTDGPFGPGDTYDQYDSDDSHIHIGPDDIYFEDPDGTRHYPDDGDGAVDIPPLKYGPPDDGAPGKGPSGGIGEPHYLTEDGVSITTQRLGEYVLSTGVAGQQVQARAQAWKKSPSAAAITALAFGVDGQRLTVEVDGTVRLDGKEAPAGQDLEFGFDKGGAAGLWRADDTGPAEVVVVVWPDLSTAWVTIHDGWLSLRLQWREPTGERRGVLGSDDGDGTNDIATRDGTVVGEAGLDNAVTSWLLTADETLFDYQDGLTTASYRDDQFPYEDKSIDLTSADEACSKVPEGFAREACRYDVGLTGVDDWVEPAAAFGDAVVADTSRRIAKASIAKAVQALVANRSATGPTSTGGQRDRQGINLSASDRSGATEESIDGSVTVHLNDGEAVTYRLVLDASGSAYALNNDLTCPHEVFEAGKAGYAYFDESGKAVIGPIQGCDDSDRADLLPGTYYLKLIGPGSIDLDLNLIPAG